MRFIFLSVDGNHAPALRRAAALVHGEHGVALTVTCFDAASLRDAAGWARLERELGEASFVFGARLFGEDLVRPLERLLAAASCPVLVITSNPALIRQTRLGKFSLAERAADEGGLLSQWARKLRPSGGAGEARRQLAVLRNLGKVLKLVPGKARDLHSYIVAHQYWANSSPQNLYRLLCLLAARYGEPSTRGLPTLDPLSYPEQALFHPDAPAPFATLDEYQKWRAKGSRGPRGKSEPSAASGAVGILAMRSVVLGGNTAHLDALVRALEARGVEARLAYAAGLDMRPAIESFFAPTRPNTAAIDLLVNASGFALVGGPAESRPADARAALEQLDVGYLAPVPLAFQRVEDWRSDWGGLATVQAALSVAVPELEGAAEPLVFGGPSSAGEAFVPAPAEIELLAERIVGRVALRRTANAAKRLALVIFNFPPNLGNVGSAAYLDVFQSLFGILQTLQADGYTVEVPANAETLRQMVVEGNALANGTDANVGARYPVADYTRHFPHYRAIEPYWGRAPGELLSDGRNISILGRQFGNVFVGVQPSFGYERDPMRLLMAQDAAPNHAFAAFYSWLRHVYAAHAVVHVGTHGALEFMPGKQVGLSADCWPTRLLGGLPNFYLYSVNNPSEAAIAKRRGGATLVSYLVPPLQQAGLYKGLRQLKDNLDSYRQRPDAGLLELIREQAEKLGLGQQETGHPEQGTAEHSTPDTSRLAPDGVQDVPHEYLAALGHELLQIEQRMVPAGLHVVGRPPLPAELVDFLALAAALRPFRRPGGGETTLPALIAESLGYDYAALGERLGNDSEAQARWKELDLLSHEAVRRFVNAGSLDGQGAEAFLQNAAHVAPAALAPLWAALGDLLARLTADGELAGLLRGLRGGFVPPSPSNDVVRDPAVLPTGRNVFSLDPARVPSPAAVERARRLVDEVLARASAEHGHLPATVAVVLWGSDNLKTDCEGVAQALALLGARPVVDELGCVSDVTLVPLAELGRPRIDLVVTVSGIFRDLLGHQLRLLNRAARLAALVDEPAELNFVRRHALAQAAALGISLEEAAVRVFANAPGSYGANVNHLVESSTWDEEAQLSEAFLSRKGFTLGNDGAWRDGRPLLEQALATVELSFQNVDSFEVGISDIDNYYESLGGITKSVEVLSGKRPTVLVADALAMPGAKRVASLAEAVRLETRAKLLNPRWYESMLSHGYEGVREIEARVNNTYGWSATANAVEGWAYQGVAETFVLDEVMRERLAALNPHAAAGVVRRLLEASGRGFWQADPSTLEQLRSIYEDLEDRLEGVNHEYANTATNARML